MLMVPDYDVWPWSALAWLNACSGLARCCGDAARGCASVRYAASDSITFAVAQAFVDTQP